MNKLTMAGSVMMLIVMLALSGVAPAATIRPPGDGTSTGGATKMAGKLELVMTVIKNEKPEVSGDLFGGIGSTSVSLKLLDSPAGNYGYLDVSADGAFRYALKNDLPQVQALGLNDLAEEVFRYQFTDAKGFTTDASLTVFVLGNPSVSFDNVEIERNNSPALAGPLHVGNALLEGQHMRGQLTTSADEDWFVFSSLGDEIIHLELCPEGSQCVDEKAWVLYVFDADLLQQHPASSKHLYLRFDSGEFNNDSSLIGIIDPCFGDRRTLDIGVRPTATPKNYLVAISSPLARSSAVDKDGNIKDNVVGCGSGSVVLVAFPFSDDQYTFKVTRTGADPFAVIPPDNTVFDATGRKLNIAKMRVNDQLYAIELGQLAATSADTPETFAIQSIQPLNEPLAADPFLPTYNPANRIVKFPQVLDTQSGAVFSVEMQYQPESGTLILLKAEPVH